MGMPQDHRAPGTHIIYVGIAISIEEPGAFASLDKYRFCAH
jgi:hypothetical protein